MGDEGFFLFGRMSGMEVIYQMYVSRGGNCLGRKTGGSLSWTLIWVGLNQLTLQTGGYNERIEMKMSFLSSDNYFHLKDHFS